MDTTFIPLWPDNACTRCGGCGVEKAWDRNGEIVAAWECSECNGTGIASERQPVETAAD